MKKKILSSLILIILCCNMPLYCMAESVDDLQEQKKDLQDQKNDAEDKLDEVKTQKSETLDQIEELNSQIESSEDDLAKYNSQVKELETSISNSEKEIAEAEENYNKQKEMLEARIVAQYKNGKTSYLDVLLNSTSLSTFISRYFLVGKVAKADSELMDEITTQKEAIEKEKEKMEQQKSEVKIAKANAEKENVKLKNAKAQKNSKVAKLSTEEKAIQDKIDEFNSAIKQAESSIQQAIQNANKYPQTGNGAGANKPLTGGSLEWPLPSKYATYSRITSYFGPRKQPTAGASTNHGAIDIGIPTGTPVYAAEIGTVIIAQWYGGYGNFVMIKHDNGVYTAYGHLSSYKVSAGQRVSRGQQIANSGSTGVSTGPHLHFEVRLSPGGKSNRVDPLNYLTL